MAVFIIAEAGVNHNGDIDRALAMIEAAAGAGVDAVKFQTFSADKLVAPGAKKADYQARATGAGDQHSMLKELELTEVMHHRLIDQCAKSGVEFMSTPFDAQAVDFLVGAGMSRIKVPSGEITNHPLLRHMATKGLPMIVSTGMADLQEILDAVEVIRRQRASVSDYAPVGEDLAILHCTSNYPAKPADVNLRAMRTIAEATGLSVGYSDHTLGLAVSTAAVALGASIIEKHFTMDKSLPGPDHGASLSVSELTDLVAQIREVEVALGSPVKAPTTSELPIRAVVRRSVTAVRPLTAGHRLTAGDLVLLRPGTGIEPKHLDSLPGRVLRAPVDAEQAISWDHLADDA